MAELFNKQAQLYAETRPSYPSQLFQFIASKTPIHDLAWDVGTGNGQAAAALASIYKNVIATDTSAQQIGHAPSLPNVRYQQTPPVMSAAELALHVAPQGSVDLVTAAQAFHWFDRPSFYEQVNWVLRKPHGVLAVWCYTEPRVDESVDPAFWHLYTSSTPFWEAARKTVDDKYQNLDFPFDPVDGAQHTGPFEFDAVRPMDLDAFLTYIRSWSAYQTAQEKGVDLLTKEVTDDFERAWGEDRKTIKPVVYPVHLRIGRVRNQSS